MAHRIRAKVNECPVLSFSDKIKNLRSLSKNEIKSAKHAIKRSGFFQGNHRKIARARIRILTSYIPGIRSIYIRAKVRSIASSKDLSGKTIIVENNPNNSVPK